MSKRPAIIILLDLFQSTSKQATTKVRGREEEDSVGHPAVRLYSSSVSHSYNHVITVITVRPLTLIFLLKWWIYLQFCADLAMASTVDYIISFPVEKCLRPSQRDFF